MQERQDSTHPYTNGTVLHNSGPVHIIASEYQKESPEPKDNSLGPKLKTALNEVAEEPEKEIEDVVGVKEKEESAEIDNEVVEEQVPKELAEEENEIDEIDSPKEIVDDGNEIVETQEDELIPGNDESNEDNDLVDWTKPLEVNNLVEWTEPLEVKKNGDILSKVTADFIEEAKKADDKITKELLEEALDEEEEEEDDEEDEHEPEKSSVKVRSLNIILIKLDIA